MTKLLPRKEKGFSLIELLVVVSLIGILATLVLANLNAARQRGRDAQRKSDLRNLQTALRLYYNDYGKYPTDDSGEILGCGAVGTTACTWGDVWTAGSTTYMPTLPIDPISTQSYVYTRNNADSYSIKACLENASDEDGEIDYGIVCSSSWMYMVEQ